MVSVAVAKQRNHKSSVNSRIAKGPVRSLLPVPKRRQWLDSDNPAFFDCKSRRCAWNSGIYSQCARSSPTTCPWIFEVPNADRGMRRRRRRHCRLITIRIGWWVRPTGPVAAGLIGPWKIHWYDRSPCGVAETLNAVFRGGYEVIGLPAAQGASGWLPGDPRKTTTRTGYIQCRARIGRQLLHDSSNRFGPQQFM